MHSFMQEYGSLLIVFIVCVALFFSGLISINREKAKRAHRLSAVPLENEAISHRPSGLPLR